MATTASRDARAISAAGAEFIAADCRGMNFYDADPDLDRLLQHYLPPDMYQHLLPHYRRLGALAGGRLDELAFEADRHPPVLRPRDRFGRDVDSIDYHPAYREMENIAFCDFGLQAMSHRGGVLDWPNPFPAVAKYAFQYLFVQAEFGLMCPISLCDTSAFLLNRYGSQELKDRYLPRMLSQSRDELWRGTQFMTEKAAGSDVGQISTVALEDDGTWRLHGDKWFCSHTDAELALLLARPEGAAAGTRGLGLFLLPRRLEDGTRNRYRIARLKDKLGTRSMASGEIVLEGAAAFPVGSLDQGLKQMMDQVNLSRLSHGVRAAAMMRRCLNEALVVAHQRKAFGGPLIKMPLLQRQLMKLMLPSEQALSMFLYTAHTMDLAKAGDSAAAKRLRILTPLIKFRACRDNVPVATGAMEIRGGNGYIEDWINPRLIRDAQVGLLWEGTSNINALDVVTRAVARNAAHETLAADLNEKLSAAESLNGQFRGELQQLLTRTCRFAEDVAAHPKGDILARKAASALYHITSAILLASEGAAIAAAGGNDRRLRLARMVLTHRLSAPDPFALDGLDKEADMMDSLLKTAGPNRC